MFLPFYASSQYLLGGLYLRGRRACYLVLKEFNYMPVHIPRWRKLLIQAMQTCDDKEKEGLEDEMLWSLPWSHFGWNE